MPIKAKHKKIWPNVLNILVTLHAPLSAPLLLSMPKISDRDMDNRITMRGGPS
jgi:hypothetical protein